MAQQAEAYVPNHGLAEEIFLMQPDLIIAGTYMTRTTVALLRRLGFLVEEFVPESSFADVRANMLKMGEILGRSERAAELVTAFDKELAVLQSLPLQDATVALYFANSYTSGEGTLVDAVVEASGLSNLAVRLGLAGTTRLPLELLIAGAPNVIVGEAGRDRRRGRTLR
ncbi:MAG: ABC transporter substrate-binding protein [Rhizobiaceae bacterium]|nr:ABC transporter substrate-binding protein [Rhizobiaceae bacterium]